MRLGIWDFIPNALRFLNVLHAACLKLCNQATVKLQLTPAGSFHGISIQGNVMWLQIKASMQCVESYEYIFLFLVFFLNPRNLLEKQSFLGR